MSSLGRDAQDLLRKRFRSSIRPVRLLLDTKGAPAVAIVVLGLGLRLAATFPLGAWPAEADSLLTGMTALRILDGELPVFFSGVRLGALESYFHAAVFSVAGVSREATALAPLTTNVALLALFLPLSRSLLGREAGVLAALFVAVPSASFLFWSHLPNGYPLTLLFCVAALLFGDRLARGNATVWNAALFGVATGLGLWNSIQTVAASAPAVAWILGHRPRFVRAPRIFAAIVAGFLLGAGPWIVFNVSHPLGILRDNFATRPAANAAQVFSNTEHVARYGIPELLVSIDPENGVNPPNALQRALRLPVAAVHAVGFLFAAALVLLTLVSKERGEGGAPGWLLLFLVALVMMILNVVSEAGGARALTVRYLLPAYFAFAGSLALLIRRLCRASPVSAWFVGGFVLIFNLSGVFWPGTAFRERMSEDARTESLALELFRQAGVEAVWGDYWCTYQLNFLSRGRIQAIPFQPGTDYQGYAARLQAAAGRWALISRRPGELATWTERAAVAGAVRELGSGYSVFFPNPNPPDSASLRQWDRRLRESR